jgi:hypothetical protein
LSTTASPEPEEFETTTLPPFVWRIQYVDREDRITSTDVRWHEICEPLLVDGHLFQVTTRPVAHFEIELPLLDVHGQRVLVSLSPPEGTPVFYFKRMAQAASTPGGNVTPHLLYAAYGYVLPEAVVQVRIVITPLLHIAIEPLFLPRPLAFPF